MIKQILLVGIGGGIGSIFRYLVGVFTVGIYSGIFPVATFVVNIVGCFVIGLLSAFFSDCLQLAPSLRLLFITGFCGGFTTFSTFAFENLYLYQNNHIFTVIIYTMLSVVLGVAAVWGGIAIMSVLK